MIEGPCQRRYLGVLRIERQAGISAASHSGSEMCNINTQESVCITTIHLPKKCVRIRTMMFAPDLADYLDDTGDPLGPIDSSTDCTHQLDRDDLQRTQLEKQNNALHA